MSPDGRFQFVYRSDGDIVLSEGNTQRWHSNTFLESCTQPSGCAGSMRFYSGPGIATMEADGNFVLRMSSGHEYWSTHTGGHPGAYLRVEDDGFVGVYSTTNLMLWSSSMKFAPTPTPGHWIEGGFSWRGIPSGKKAGDCVGNCGAGCGDANNPCGGPEQYWELALKTEPAFFQAGVEQTVCNAGVYYVRPWEEVHAIGAFTYHGFVKQACIDHDKICNPNDWTPGGFFGCFVWTGCGPYRGWTQAWSSPDEWVVGYRYTGEFVYGGACVDPPPPDPMG
jgi:hypothetical protein